MAQENNPLKKYHWKNRLLVIYSQSTEGDKLAAQKTNYELSISDYQERDVIAFQLTPHEFKNVSTNDKPDGDLETVKDFLSINKEQDFKVFLLGKDGTIKLQSEEVLPNEKIFKTIDAMPMRQEEMRKEE